MNSKEVGDLSEVRVLESFTKKGWSVSIPFGESDSYDFVVEIDNELQKIQVKTGRLDEETVKCNLDKTRYNSSGASSDYYDSDEVDLFAIYCSKIDEIFVVPFDEAPSSTLHLRVGKVWHSNMVDADEYKL